MAALRVACVRGHRACRLGQHIGPRTRADSGGRTHSAMIPSIVWSLHACWEYLLAMAVVASAPTTTGVGGYAPCRRNAPRLGGLAFAVRRRGALEHVSLDPHECVEAGRGKYAGAEVRWHALVVYHDPDAR